MFNVRRGVTRQSSWKYAPYSWNRLPMLGETEEVIALRRPKRKSARLIPVLATAAPAAVMPRVYCPFADQFPLGVALLWSLPPNRLYWMPYFNVCFPWISVKLVM